MASLCERVPGPLPEGSADPDDQCAQRLRVATFSHDQLSAARITGCVSGADDPRRASLQQTRGTSERAGESCSTRFRRLVSNNLVECWSGPCVSFHTLSGPGRVGERVRDARRFRCCLGVNAMVVPFGCADSVNVAGKLKIDATRPSTSLPAEARLGLHASGLSKSTAELPDG